MSCDVTIRQLDKDGYKQLKWITDGLPENYRIYVFGKYIKNGHYNYKSYKHEDVVETYSFLLYLNNELDYIENAILKPKTRKLFSFFKKHRKETWKEKVERITLRDVEWLRKKAYKIEQENKITDGLLDSLDNL